MCSLYIFLQEIYLKTYNPDSWLLLLTPLHLPSGLSGPVAAARVYVLHHVGFYIFLF